MLFYHYAFFQTIPSDIFSTTSFYNSKTYLNLWFSNFADKKSKILSDLQEKRSCNSKYYITVIYDWSYIVTEPNLGPFAWNTAKASYWHWVAVTESTAFTAGSSKANLNLMLRRPELPDGFQRRIFKDSVRESVTVCTILWLVDGEVTEWCFRNLNHQPSGSNWTGTYLLVVSMQLTYSTWWGI